MKQPKFIGKFFNFFKIYSYRVVIICFLLLIDLFE